MTLTYTSVPRLNPAVENDWRALLKQHGSAVAVYDAAEVASGQYPIVTPVRRLQKIDPIDR
jgi:hypothetical protein